MSTKGNKNKRSTFKIKVAGLLSLAVLIIISTSYMAYKNFNEVIYTVKAEGRPDLKLLQLKDVVSNLSEGSNSVRSYVITGEEKYLTPYYTALVSLDENFEQLRVLCKSDKDDTRQLDSLSFWVDKKTELWKKNLALRHGDRVTKVLKDISATIDSTKEKDKAFLQRVFKTENQVSVEKLQQDIEKTTSSELKILRNQKDKELKLVTEDDSITASILSLVGDLETREVNNIQLKTQRADKLVDKANIQILAFCIAATAMLLFAFFMVSSYLQKAALYEQYLEKTQQEAENIGRMKERFLASMSHEMRTPLNSISGLIDQLLRSEQKKEQTQELEIMQRSTKHLINIANDILDFSKLEAGKVELETIDFNIREAFEDVRQMLAPLAKTKGINYTHTVDENIPVALVGDPVRLKQILINLVSNALKFTEKGYVSVSVKASITDAQNLILIIEVSDTGIGISKEKLAFIFDDFSQAEVDTSRRYGGTGLGLSIVKKLLGLHQGEIDVKSDLGKGTTFVCTIPYQVGDESQVARRETRRVSYLGLSGLKVLIVDDEEYNLLVLEKILTRWQVSYTSAKNGEDALDKFKKDDFDLVMLDLNMPIMSGEEFTSHVREILGSETPIIALTGAVSGIDREQWKKTGIDVVLPKPYNEDLLYSEVCRLLGVDTHKKILPVEAAKPETAKYRIINLSHLRRLSNGDDKFVLDMLKSFIATTEKGVNEIKLAIAAEDWEKVANSTHRIAAPCRHLEAERLLNLLKSIEIKARDEKERVEVPGLFVMAEQSLAEVVQEINEEIGVLQA